MVYSSRVRAGIGEISHCFDELDLTVQDKQFLRHGFHAPKCDAPLVLIACSGGRDSLALVALASKVCASRGLRCGVVIVNHNLQSSSEKVAIEASNQCKKLGISSDLIYIESIKVLDSGIGIEAAARDARYAAIIRRAKILNASVVLLAHTADDQAETVVIGLRDSSGLEAIAGMNAIIFRDGIRFARPLLQITRDETTGICEDFSIKWWDDPTNGDCVPKNQELHKNYPLRSRVRHTLIPYISHFFNANIVNLLSRGAKLAQDDLEYINSQVDDVVSKVMTVNFYSSTFNDSDSKHCDNCACDNCASSITSDNKNIEITLDVKTLKDFHISIRRRVIARALSLMNLRFSSSHITSIDELISNWHGQKPVSLPCNVKACRVGVKNASVIRLCNYR
ncbi:tRNA lysidine(34) synthetase TilS [Gardnerella sp. DNF00502]|uniref:tRNA lysidine(34) synthetase TilS n=1 Tax=unclassified Gardnerella TaxID=2628112 RepID=UPI000C9EF1D2|nr:tRNA lysidine(34) synthetase TilS [Gardnerella sp. KA00735]PNP89587.1 tRNA lysidine(34) synthetase TilS [Gardnerella sp. KA00735]